MAPIFAPEHARRMSNQQNNSSPLSTFLDAISRHDLMASGTVYRGHQLADWELKPTISRPNTLNLIDQLAKAIQPAGGLTMFQKEVALVLQFANSCDQAGLQCPYPSYWASLYDKVARSPFSYSPDVFKELKERWWSGSAIELDETVALAQHHRVPTRLLDWTNRPLIAAYFAASGAVREMFSADESKLPELEEREIKVWSVRLERISNLLKSKGQSGPHCLRIVRAPRALNANLHAQSGLFSMITGDDPPALDEFVKSAEIGEIVEGVTLKWKHVPELAKHLRVVHGITAASIYPGYRGVLEAMEEHSRELSVEGRQYGQTLDADLASQRA